VAVYGSVDLSDEDLLAQHKELLIPRDHDGDNIVPDAFLDEDDLTLQRCGSSISASGIMLLFLSRHPNEYTTFWS
jgi:hypothetical protein